uniref:Uncharacterized protein n=1 Tax=Wuchereria bancrofti TaxID=6293 RepID=A0AAF5PH00_WUCBA
MDILRAPKPTVETIQQNFQLLNVLVDNYDPPVNEIHREGLDTILIEEMQFKIVFIQYYAKICFIGICYEGTSFERFSTTRIKTGKQGITAVLERDVFLIIQEVRRFVFAVV